MLIHRVGGWILNVRIFCLFVYSFLFERDLTCKTSTSTLWVSSKLRSWNSFILEHMYMCLCAVAEEFVSILSHPTYVREHLSSCIYSWGSSFIYRTAPVVLQDVIEGSWLNITFVTCRSLLCLIFKKEKMELQMLTPFTTSHKQQMGVTIVTGAIRTLTSSEADAGNIWISKQAVGKNQPHALEWGIYQPGICVLGYDYMFNASCSAI